MGWNNTFRYKNWELNVFFRGSTGFQRLNITRFATSTMVPESRFITSREGYEKSWDIVANKADAEFASSKNAQNRSTPRSTQWLEDADFVRLQNLSLTYTLPRRTTRFADITLGVSAQNLFTLTKYKGLDQNRLPPRLLLPVLYPIKSWDWTTEVILRHAHLHLPLN